jgi:hypothetical protein
LRAGSSLAALINGFSAAYFSRMISPYPAEVHCGFIKIVKVSFAASRSKYSVE